MDFVMNSTGQMWYFLIVFWLLCGVVSAVVASNKGRSGCGWLIVGFLLGPFGFVLSLVVSKDESSVEKEALMSGTVKKCPYCAELIKREAIICRYCGKDLNAAEIPQSIISSRGDSIDLDDAWKKFTSLFSFRSK